MTDTLERICGLSDLSAPDRLRLQGELAFTAGFLRQIDRGAGFCEDRGLGWTAGQERVEGSDRLMACLRAWPILRRLLPRLRHYRHQSDPVIGLGAVPHDDVEVAVLLVGDRWSFTGSSGEGLSERAIRVTLEAHGIRVSAEPPSAAEWTGSYAEPKSGPFWTDLERKLPAGDAKRAAMLAARMRATDIPCDLCGRTVQSFDIVGTVLTDTRPGSGPRQTRIDARQLLSLRRALAAQDVPALQSLNPAWAEGYSSDVDASYCREHAG